MTDDAYTLEEGEWIPNENDLIDEGLCQTLGLLKKYSIYINYPGIDDNSFEF